MSVSKGLIIKQPWVDLILIGQKTWEIRGSKTHVRGRIAIIQSGSKQIFGYVDLVDCIGPVSGGTMDANRGKHRIYKNFVANYQEYNMPYPKTYAWVLENPYRLKTPKPYNHPAGAVIWVNL